MNFLTIPEFFKDKEIFVTGGSGFIGKVLIEKLLRSCPDLKVIYLLIREKKGKAIQERVDTILKNGLFDIVRQNNPAALKKVVAVAGDVSLLGLGLNESDKRLVLNSNIVFHVAASVRFDDHLRKATLMNTRGTREVMELMLQMPKLVVGVHVSTTYCNTDKYVIEEKIYRDHGDWKEAIRFAENFEDDYKLACLTEKVLGGLRNTYLYTKHLAENIVEDYSDRLPLVVFRPGVVVSVWQEPIPGWIDNWNGPVGLNIAVGKGLLRVMYTDPKLLLDYAPVDMIIKGLLIATWKKVTQSESKEILPVYNCSMFGTYHLTQEQAYELGMEVNAETPYKTIWYPRCCFTNDPTLFWLLFFFYNIVPGFFLDSLLKISGKQPMVLKILRKAYIAILAVGYFTKRNWGFKSKGFWNLRHELLPEDKKGFFYDMNDFDPYQFALNGRIGSSRFILNEPENEEEYKRIYKRNKFLYYAIVYSLFGIMAYLVITSRFWRNMVTMHSLL